MWISRNAMVVTCVFCMMFALVKIRAQARNDETTTTTSGCIEQDRGEEATCLSPDATIKTTATVCGIHRELCHTPPAKHGSLYRHGGSAQAYVPNAPVKSQVCNQTSMETSKYKVATWSISRSTRRVAPKLSIKAKLWSCSSPSSSTANDQDCCCSELSADTESPVSVQVWQARPDGTYSTIRSQRGAGDSDCRATVVSQNGDGAELEFTTVSPGSTGSLGGLGPSSSSWDVPPFGPPVLHMLAQVADGQHEPLLIDLPVLFHAKTLEQRHFWGGDWRAHMGKRTSQADPYKVTSWKVVSTDDNTGTAGEIQVELDLFLTRRDGSLETLRDLAKQELCPSFLPASPSWFWVQPIAVCTPSLLNFFPL